MTRLELITELQERLSVTSTNTFWTSTMVAKWIDRAVLWATNLYRWPFTERAEYTKSRAASRYYDYPKDTTDGPPAFKSDSIRFCQIEQSDGVMEEYTKIRYIDFMRYLEGTANGNNNGTDKIFSDYKRRVFINPVVSVSERKICIWGQEKSKKLVADADTSPFDEGEETGDEAILQYALAIALRKARRYDEAKAERTEAVVLLNEVWARVEQEQAQYRTKDAPYFEVPNYFKTS